jgi:hypothetical protein
MGMMVFAVSAVIDPSRVDATVPVGLGLYIVGGAVSGDAAGVQ